MARPDDVESRFSWSMLVTFPVCALVALWAFRYAWDHRKDYFNPHNYEFSRIPAEVAETVRASAVTPSNPDPELPPWVPPPGAARQRRSR